MAKKDHNTDHPNRELIEETLQLLNLSSMEEEERNMWTIFLPSMEKEEIEQFKKILETEVKELMEIYLEAKELPKTKAKKKS